MTMVVCSHCGMLLPHDKAHDRAIKVQELEKFRRLLLTATFSVPVEVQITGFLVPGETASDVVKFSLTDKQVNKIIEALS